MIRGKLGEVKHLSSRRKRNQAKVFDLFDMHDRTIRAFMIPLVVASEKGEAQTLDYMLYAKRLRGCEVIVFQYLYWKEQKIKTSLVESGWKALPQKVIVL